MHAMSKIANRSAVCLIVASGLLLGLSACGGGSSNGSSQSALPTTPVAITSSNQSAVAGAAVDSMKGGTSTPIAAQTTTSSSASADSVAHMVGQIGQAAVQQILTQSNAPMTVTGVSTPYACPLTGMYSIDVSGTSGTVTYNNCSNVANETINGTVSIGNVVYNGTALSFDSSYNLTITIPGDALAITGDMHLSSPCATCTLTLTGTSLRYTSSVNGTVALQNYTMAFDSYGALTQLTYTFSSTILNGTAIFNMVTPFVETYGRLFPHSGVATVTGANSSVLKITILGDETAAPTSQVQLELSSNGGATYGAPTLVTWASISNRL